MRGDFCELSKKKESGGQKTTIQPESLLHSYILFCNSAISAQAGLVIPQIWDTLEEKTVQA